MSIGSDSEDDVYFSCSSHSSDSDDSVVCNIPSLSSTIDSVFCSVPKHFNIVHINAQSIPAHFPDMLASFDSKDLHAILISESWLKPCLPSTSYALPGFNLIRNDRIGRVGGGVAIYLRSYIPFSIVSKSPQPPPSNAGEHFFIEILFSHTKLLLGVYYCPSLHINYFASFETLLEDFLPSYDHSIIMGDFNTCLLKCDSRSSSLQSIITANNLSILSLDATHHFPNSIPSLLDLMIVSSLNHVSKHGQCTAAFSYHDLIYLSYKVRPPKAKPKIFLQRNFRGIDLDSLRCDAREIDWDNVFNAVSIDSKVSVFYSSLMELYDKHAPLRPVKMKHLPAPWLDESVRTAMHKKLTAKAKCKYNPTDDNRRVYNERRNHCNRLCRDRQRRFIHSSLANDDPAKVWKFLRSLGVGKSRQDSIPNNLDLDVLNHHFSDSVSFDGHTKTSTLNFLSSLPTPDHSPFSFMEITDRDIKKGVDSISSNAVGSDLIGRKMILLILDEILPVIRHILNTSVSSGEFPSTWKEALVTPLPKKSNPSNLSDFRPISILPFLSKLLERLVYNQITPFLTRYNLLNPFQSGFRPGHSTVTSLVKITDDIRCGMSKQKLTVMALLDFSNAFNNIDFDIMVELLRSLNFSPEVISWFHSYLHGRRQRVRIDERFSSWCDIKAGVPQGGVLSPLLFSIFINSISCRLTSSYHLYADDLQIYTQEPLETLHQAIDRINSDLRHISTWSKQYGLTFNVPKTQVIVVGSSRMVSRIDWFHLPQVILDGIHVHISDKVKNLGILIDRHLSWAPQIAEVSRKLFASAASLRRLRNFLPTTTKIALAQSLLLPILDYADACYLDLTEEQLNKLERLQNFCIRFIYGLRKFDHVSFYRKELKWLPIRLRRNTHILNLLYCILFLPHSPPYLKERFVFCHQSNSRFLRSSLTLQLNMPLHTSQYYDKSFTVEAVRLWNALPLPIKHAKSLCVFKTKLKEHYLTLV